MSSTGRPVTDFDGWMRDIERRMSGQERRPAISSAADLLGPGLAPKAVLISDWSGEATQFNGVFWSDVGAQNTPDFLRRWIGWNLIDSEGRGYQRVVNYSDDDPQVFAAWPPVTYVRGFTATNGGQTRIFSPWTTEYPAQEVIQASDTTINTTGGVALMTVAQQVFNPAEVYEVSVSLDVAHAAVGTSQELRFSLLANAAVIHACAFHAQGLAGLRVPISFTRQITGLPAGLNSFTTRAALGSAGDTYSIRATNSAMSVRRCA